MQDAAKQDVVVWYGLQDALLQEPGGAHAGEKHLEAEPLGVRRVHPKIFKSRLRG